jgi:hypothetical protein
VPSVIFHDHLNKDIAREKATLCGLALTVLHLHHFFVGPRYDQTYLAYLRD